MAHRPAGTPCNHCGEPCLKGRVYCSKDCQKLHFNSQQVTCSWCEKTFPLKNRGQAGALNAGRRIYCSRKCQAAFSFKSIRQFRMGPCPTCGKYFLSTRRNKLYCDMKCYMSDPVVVERLGRQGRAIGELSRKKAEERHKNDPNSKYIGPENVCKNCGKHFRGKKKYCNQGCRREYFNARFDRWIASPEKIALPQNYDEFLLQEELPCLVETCEWSGKHLSSHMNKAHGVTADEFKELAGFNRSTGLVSHDVHKVMSERAKERIEEGVVSLVAPGTPGMPGRGGGKPPRLEAKEHINKSQAIARSELSDNIVFCRWCKLKIPTQPKMAKKLYCNTYCRSQWYYHQKTDVVCPCSYCGEKMVLIKSKLKRHNQGQPVCCSLDCRNRLNIVQALKVRRT